MSTLVKKSLKSYGSTTIALLITSSHPAEAGVMDEVVKILVDAGAKTDEP
jgi:hypothetical protein